jgi:RHS repeat-associated protein
VGAVKPTSNAGEDQRAQAGDLVKLDGSKSVDRNGLPLTYSWTILETPEGSAATLDDPRSVTPSFTVDRPGSYKLQLIVSDDKATGDPDLVEISTEALPPTADAGEAQSVALGATVMLDGRKSKSLNGLPLTYTWSFVSRPEGSLAELEDAATATPQFTADQPGDYVVKLVVGDAASPASEPATVLISTHEVAPVANAGEAQTVTAYTEVTLDGSESHDPQGYPLTYAWTVLTQPEGSDVQLSDAAAEQPTFTPEILGTYVFQLVVNNGNQDGEPATVKIEVAALTVEVPDLTGKTLEEAESELAKRHLVKGAVTSSHHATIAEGKIISQTPTAGTSAVAGASVALEVSLGPSVAVMVETPDVVGKTEEEAKLALSAKGLASEVVTTGTSETIPAGSILRQLPAAGVSVAVGSSVGLVISTGMTSTTTVPNVVGMKKNDALEALAVADLTLGELTYANEAAAAGNVVAQTPAQGAAAAPGLPVSLRISLGANVSLPPDPAIVAPPLDPTVPTRMADAMGFLYDGPNPVQKDVAEEAIDEERLGVIKGNVFDREGNPLSGVTVAVKEHPGFGYTLTREDGAYDLAVTGMDTMTLSYQKEGWLPAYRQIEAPALDYTFAPDVRLVQPDLKVSPVDLGSPGAEIQVAQSSLVTDEDGARQATMLFTPGTEAEMVLPDGSRQALSTMNVRVTEFTVGANGPEAMPASLPPQSAYTWAAEFSVDEAVAAGATNVEFSKPVVTYVDNFVGFPVGTPAPLGYYDKAKGVWVADDSGVVIGIVSITGGLAEVDTTGDGVADNTGIDDAERAKLAELYPAGHTLWRVEIKHFSLWDINWSWLLTIPKGVRPPFIDTLYNWLQNHDPSLCGSVIGCFNQSLGESVPVAGTPYSLTYLSTRSPRQPVSSATVNLSNRPKTCRSGSVSGASMLSVSRWIDGKWDAANTVANVAASAVMTAGVISDVWIKAVPLLYGCYVDTSEPEPPAPSRVEVSANVAGNQHFWNTSPNGSVTITWDGNDPYGRHWNGDGIVRGEACYVYRTYFRITERFAANEIVLMSGTGSGIGGISPNIAFIADARKEEKLCTDFSFTLPNPELPSISRTQSLGGWTLDVHHAYNSDTKTLLKGNGQQIPASEMLKTRTGGTMLDFSTVPNVVGMTQEGAVAAIRAAGLAYGNEDKGYSWSYILDPAVPEGKVVQQSPAAGVYVDKGTAVLGNVSIGPAVKVPNVVGMTQEEAVAAIKDAGLNVGGIQRIPKPDISEGEVTWQTVAAGIYVGKGSSVGFEVSTGETPSPNTVPELRGMTSAEAVELILASGQQISHVYTVLYPIDGNAGNEIIVAQSPSAGGIVNGAYAFDLWISYGLPAVETPDVRWKTEEEAKAIIETAGLQVGGVSRAFYPSVAEGLIYDQSPAVGVSVELGSAVTVSISQKAAAEVPDVRGKTESAATAIIEAAGLQFGGVSRAFYPSVAEGLIYDQSPEVGVSVELGTAVSVSISQKAAAEVPDVRGKTESAAQAILEAAGLQIGGANHGFYPSVSEGLIYDQSPEVGVSVELGTVVSVYVAKKAAAEVPDVRGKTESAATAIIEAAGLQFGGSSHAFYPSVSEGLIYDQSPEVGVSVELGTAVSVYFSKKAAAEVPDVRGKTESAAQAILEAAGLQVGGANHGFYPSVSEGLIYDQSPEVGVSVELGTTVNVSVARKAAVEIPDVRGKTESAAQAILEAAGLQVGGVSSSPAPYVTAGKVIDQSPAVGVSVELGTSVNLGLSSGPQDDLPLSGSVVSNTDGSREEYDPESFAELNTTGMTVAPDGSVYVGIESSGIWRMDATTSRWRKVAGSAGCTAPANYADGMVAMNLCLYRPTDLQVGIDGSVYFIEPSLNGTGDTYDKKTSMTDGVLVRIDPQGIVHRLAGGQGACDYSGSTCGDGGLSSAAQFGGGFGELTLAPEGNLYFHDYANRRVRYIAPDGLIHSLDDTEIRQAYASADIEAITVAPDSSLHIAWAVEDGEGRAHLLRQLRPDGVMLTTNRISGNCFVADGSCAPEGAVDQVTLENISQIFARGDGNIQVLSNSQVLSVNADGLVVEAAALDKTGENPTAGGLLRTMGVSAIGSSVLGSVYSPRVGLDPSGNYYYVSRMRGVSNAFSDIIRKVFYGFSASGGEINVPDGDEIYVFNSQGRHLRTLDALTQAVKYVFGYTSSGLLSSITDGDGNATTIERSSGGGFDGGSFGQIIPRIAYFGNDGGFIVPTLKSAVGEPLAIVGPYGHRTKLGVDDSGWLSYIADPEGNSHVVTYYYNGLLESFTDPNGNTSVMTYDSKGKLLKDENAAGGFTRLSSVTSGSGGNSVQTVTITSAEGRVRQMRIMDVNGNASSRISVAEDGTVSAVRYEEDGSYKSRTADGTVVQVSMAPDVRFGQAAAYPAVAEVRMPSGLTSTTTITQRGDFTNSSNPLSATKLAYVMSENGRVSNAVYDIAGRKATTTSPMGRQSVQTFDAKGRVLTASVPGIAAVNYVYDGDGRLKAVTQGSGAKQRRFSFDYRDDGFVGVMTDALSQTVKLDYDRVGRLKKQTLADNSVMGFKYDNSGNVTSIAPPGQPEHKFYYNPVNQTSFYDPPTVTDITGDTLTEYEYNLDKQLTRIALPGKNIDLNYEADSGRLESVATPSGRYVYGYDDAGRVSGVTAPGNERLTFSYDGALPLGETWVGTVNGKVAWSFDANFWGRTQTVNGASAVSYDYDSDGLVTRAGNLTLTSDAQNGLLTGTALGAVTDSWSYDEFGEPGSYSVTAAGVTVFSLAFTRDNLGRITDKTETVVGGNVVWHYDYDGTGRLTDVAQNGAAASHYEYDANGNRTAARYVGPVISGTYDAQDRMLTYGANTYQYADTGDLTAKTSGAGKTGYVYDVMGNLRSATLPNGTHIEYVIDGQDRRVGKKVNGALEQGFLYDGALQIVAELDGAGAIVSRFVYTGSGNVPAYMVRGGVEYRIVTDHLGSPRLVIDASTGEIVQRMDYDEFGNVMEDTNPGFQPFGFAGGLYDLDTGLVRFGARDYDSESGRWTAKDPIGFDGGDSNIYAYVSNDPINYLDVSGLWTGVDDGVFFAGGVAVGLFGQAVSDVVSGKFSGWESYGGAAAGGAFGAMTMLYTGSPWAAGAANGMVANITTQGLNNLTGKQSGLDVNSLAMDALLGAALGRLPGSEIPGITISNGYSSLFKQMTTKLRNGSISSVKFRVALKMYVGANFDDWLLAYFLPFYKTEFCKYF